MLDPAFLITSRGVLSMRYPCRNIHLLKNTQMDINVSMLYLWTMDVHKYFYVHGFFGMDITTDIAWILQSGLTCFQAISDWFLFLELQLNKRRKCLVAYAFCILNLFSTRMYTVPNKQRCFHCASQMMKQQSSLFAAGLFISQRFPMKIRASQSQSTSVRSKHNFFTLWEF